MKPIAGKIFILVQVVCLIALGVLGLLIPVIPGLLFLMLAALIAARYCPALEAWLSRNRYAAECMRISNGFLNLDIRDRLRLCFWGTAKFTLNGIEWSVQLLARQFRKLMQTRIQPHS